MTLKNPSLDTLIRALPWVMMTHLTGVALISSVIAAPPKLSKPSKPAPARRLEMRYPLSASPSVSSTFGTYRINHHHSGIDLYAHEGTPVIAAADGFVSLIKRGSGGYGRAVYLKHEGGFMTLYAHLAAFAPPIQALIDARERKRGDFTIKMRPREKIRFKAGDVIGWSGTSGTDLCHLHFELRHKNVPLNPLTHGLTIPDQSAPTLIALFADPLDERARVEGEMRPHRYDLNPRPKVIGPIAPALEQTQVSAQAEIPEEVSSSKSSSKPISDPLTIKITGNVGLSLEVEDRIDGSLRGLTPHQIKLYVDDRLIHHLSYDHSSYADKRSSSLDFDVSRRGEGEHLVHRLYRYGPRVRALKRGSTSPLKRLKRGLHPARVVAIDAAGNRSEQTFTLSVESPPDPPCALKRRRLPRGRRARRETRPLWRPSDPLHPQVTWRAYGLSFTLPHPCSAERPLEVDLRINGRRVSRRYLSLSPLASSGATQVPKGGPNTNASLNLHLNKIPKSWWGDDSKQAKRTKKKSKKKSKKKTHKGDATGDVFKRPEEQSQSLQILVGLRGLSERSEAEPAGDQASGDDKTREPPVFWYSISIHHVTSGAYFDAEGVQVRVGKDAPFKPYITSAARLPRPKTLQVEDKRDQKSSTQARGRLGLVGQEVVFASPWTPMLKANEVLLELSRRARRQSHLGAYLTQGVRQWWVSLRWPKRGISASSTHLAHFAVLRDDQPPKIGEPQWDLKPPLGPRLIIPVSDELSGVSRVTFTWGGDEVPVELQRSWSRLIYRPRDPVKPGEYAYEVSLKDRVGHHVTREGTLMWPPPDSSQLSLKARSRQALTPP